MSLYCQFPGRGNYEHIDVCTLFRSKRVETCKSRDTKRQCFATKGWGSEGGDCDDGFLTFPFQRFPPHLDLPEEVARSTLE